MQPDKGEVEEFMVMLKTMDADVVCECALDLLTHKKKEVRGKAWSLIGRLTEDDKCKAFVMECMEEMEMRAKNEEQVRVKLIAKKVMKTIGGGGGVNSGLGEGKERGVSLEDAVKDVERTASITSEGDLLDFGGTTENGDTGRSTAVQSEEESYVKVDTPPKSRPAPPPPPPPGTTGGDMFGGMNVKSTTPPPTTTSTSTLTPTPTPKPQPTPA
eukprot:CAMPEP_0118648412 /NCGR_PEP_ID=MMETSP0785-20121206/9141_1 /TAXON_ID=91992 /ORGANISM="Bolidomonas pacifica, Strain CCMP 1866" /LENGTH=213 /DNA_ID=CAMNT_0006540601 /DNA_START=74 /DNA_END=712 /DNA_ORIENTATION=-